MTEKIDSGVSIPKSSYQEERGKRQVQPNTQDPKQSRPILQPIVLGTLTFSSNPTQLTVGAAGSAAALPINPTGYLQFNIGNTNYLIPFYAVGSGSAATTWLPLTGGTMSGAIVMGTNKIVGLASASASGDALSWGQAFTAGNITFNPTTSGVVGTTTNDNATAGNIGEQIRGYQGTPTNFPTSNNWGDLTTIALTAGDWDVSIVADASNNGSTTTVMKFGISTTSGNSATGLNFGDNAVGSLIPTAVTDSSASISNFRMSFSTTTNVYLKYFATYSLGNPQATGRLSARRIR